MWHYTPLLNNQLMSGWYSSIIRLELTLQPNNETVTEYYTYLIPNMVNSISHSFSYELLKIRLKSIDTRHIIIDIKLVDLGTTRKSEDRKFLNKISLTI